MYKTEKNKQTVKQVKLESFIDNCVSSQLKKDESEFLKIKNIAEIKYMPISEIWKSKAKNSLRKQSKNPNRWSL